MAVQDFDVKNFGCRFSVFDQSIPTRRSTNKPLFEMKDCKRCLWNIRSKWKDSSIPIPAYKTATNSAPNKKARILRHGLSNVCAAFSCVACGGEGEIRTPGTCYSTPDFESGTFDHSDTSPVVSRTWEHLKKIPLFQRVAVAESEGFEPPEPRGSTVFKTAAIDHSANSPRQK